MLLLKGGYGTRSTERRPAYRLGRLFLEKLVDGLFMVSFALAKADDPRLEAVVPRFTLVLVFRRHSAKTNVLYNCEILKTCRDISRDR